MTADVGKDGDRKSEREEQKKEEECKCVSSTECGKETRGD